MYESGVSVLVLVAGSEDRPRHVSVVSYECDSQLVIDEVSFEDEEDTGTKGADHVGVGGDFFAGCSPEEFCTRTVCLDASNHEATLAGVEFQIRASVTSEDLVDYDVAPIDVPIDLTLEEVEL